MTARRQKLTAATVEDLVEAFLASKDALAWRPKTHQEFARILRIEVVPALGHLKPEEVKRGEIRALVDRLSDRAPVMANRVFEVTRRLYTWAIGKDLVETSPCVGLSKPSPEKQRDRVLTEDEIRAVWTACDTEPGIIADAFRLMLVTAQRRGEVLSMRWQDVDGAWWTIPAELAKNDLAHRVPLSSQALTILEQLRKRAKGPWVFPSPTRDRPIENPQKAAERLRERSRVPDADVHGPLIQALRARGWDVVRAVDLYPQGTSDAVHLERAAKEGRVLISNDQDMELIANRWLAEGRAFRGLILWPQQHYKRMSIGELVAAIEALTEPFPHPVIHIKPRP